MSIWERQGEVSIQVGIAHHNAPPGGCFETLPVVIYVVRVCRSDSTLHAKGFASIVASQFLQTSLWIRFHLYYYFFVILLRFSSRFSLIRLIAIDVSIFVHFIDLV